MTSSTAGKLTTGPISGHLTRMAVPMMWALLAIMSVDLVDTYFVGLVGDRELVAMGFIFPVSMVTLSFGIGMSAGLSSVLSRALGQGNTVKARRIATDGFILAAAIVTILAGIGMATINPLFSALGAPPDIIQLLRVPMVLVYCASVFLIITMMAIGTLRAAGDTKIPSRLLIGAALINACLDPILIFGLLGAPEMGIVGAMLSTLIARLVSAGVALWILVRREKILTLEFPGFDVLLSSWLAILRVGIPAVATNMIVPLGGGFIVALLANISTEAVAGFNVAARLESVAMVIFYAVSSIIGPVAGQNLGAGRSDRMRQAMRQLTAFCLVSGAVMMTGLWLAGPTLVSYFGESGAIAATAALYLATVPASYGLLGILISANGAFNGAGRPMPAVMISVLRTFVLSVPLAWLLSKQFGLQGIFIGLAAGNAIAGLAAFIWFERYCATLGADNAAASANAAVKTT